MSAADRYVRVVGNVFRCQDCPPGVRHLMACQIDAHDAWHERIGGGDD